MPDSQDGMVIESDYYLIAAEIHSPYLSHPQLVHSSSVLKGNSPHPPRDIADFRFAGVSPIF